MLAVGGSVTTYKGQNPSFSVFEVDVETMLPLKKTTYSFDVNKANTDGYPTWVSFDWLS